MFAHHEFLKLAKAIPAWENLGRKSKSTQERKVSGTAGPTELSSTFTQNIDTVQDTAPQNILG